MPCDRALVLCPPVPRTRTPRRSWKLMPKPTWIKSIANFTIRHLHPCGIDNPDPVFWTANVQVEDQQIVGKGHLKLTVSQATGNTAIQTESDRLEKGARLLSPPRVDIAYRLRENSWNGNITIELLGGCQPSSITFFFPSPTVPLKAVFDLQSATTLVAFETNCFPRIRIKNPEGKF